MSMFVCFGVCLFVCLFVGGGVCVLAGCSLGVCLFVWVVGLLQWLVCWLVRSNVRLSNMSIVCIATQNSNNARAQVLPFIDKSVISLRGIRTLWIN